MEHNRAQVQNIPAIVPSQRSVSDNNVDLNDDLTSTNLAQSEPRRAGQMAAGPGPNIIQSVSAVTAQRGGELQE
jgi:hypothetical protein